MDIAVRQKVTNILTVAATHGTIQTLQQKGQFHIIGVDAKDLPVPGCLQSHFGKTVRFVDTVESFFHPDTGQDFRIEPFFPLRQFSVPFCIAPAGNEDNESIRINIFG